MLIAPGVITLDLPAIDLRNRKGEAVLFQLNGLMYTGFSTLEPVTDQYGTWFRITDCMCHGLIEDEECSEYALYRLSLLANELEF